MIFWRVARRVPLLVKTLRIQNICVDKTVDLTYRGKKIKSKSRLMRMIGRTGGIFFVQNVAMISKKLIVIHNLDSKKVVRIPFYRNFTFDMITYDLPRRLVVDTKDIEVIRELIARGHKLSWFAESLEFGGNFPGLFEFEHLFLSPTSGVNGVLMPDGVLRKIRARRYKKNFTYLFDPAIHLFFNKKYERFSLLDKLWRKIGMYPNKLLMYVSRYHLIKNRAIKKARGTENHYNKDKKNLLYMSQSCQIKTLIILSVTYMVWKRSNCVTIAKRNATKE